MANEHKHDHWQQHIEAWQQSQISQRAYCKQHGLSLASFGYWRTRLKPVSKPGKKLLPVTMLRSSNSVSLHLPAGIRLEAPIDSLSEILPIVYRAVQELR